MADSEPEGETTWGEGEFSFQPEPTSEEQPRAEPYGQPHVLELLLPALLAIVAVIIGKNNS